MFCTRKSFTFLILISVISVLVACGGGGSGSNTPPQTPLSSPGKNANLSDIKLSVSSLGQLFQPSLLNYTVTVGYLASQISITLVTEDAGANVMVNGIDTIETGNVLGITEGNNIITIIVTAEDGVTTQVYKIDITRNSLNTLQERTKLKASNVGGIDFYGDTVEVDGNTLVIASTLEDGIDDGTQADSGAIYILTKDNSGSYIERQILKASNIGVGDLFGASLALDGDTLVVGAHLEDGQDDGSQDDSGAVYVFTRNGDGIWSEQQILKASNVDANDQFGLSVAIDGNILVVGAYSEDGEDTATKFNAGAVYVFIRDDNGIFTQQQIIRASNNDIGDEFGWRVALDSSTLIVCAGFEDGADDGTQDNNGAVYVFTLNNSNMFVEQQILRASDFDTVSGLGWSLAIQNDTIVAGAGYTVQRDFTQFAVGAVYVFERDGNGVYTETQRLMASNGESNDRFGEWGVVLQNENLVISAAFEDGIDDGTQDMSGAAYIFTKNMNGEWLEKKILKASNVGFYHAFGKAFDLDGEILLVGAVGENGIDNGTQDRSGAAYIFK